MHSPHIRTGFWLISLSALLALLGSLSACGRRQSAPAGPGAASPAPDVAAVQKRDMAEACVEDGVLEPTRVASIPIDPALRVLEVLVHEGEAVKSGKALLRADFSELDGRLRIAEAEVAALELRRRILQERRETVDIVEAEQQADKARAEADEAGRAARLKLDLHGLGMASRNERDAALARRDAAESALHSALFRLHEIEGAPISPEMADLDAKLLRARIDLDLLGKRLKKAAPIAPFDGVVLALDKSLRQPLPPDGATIMVERGPALLVGDIASMRVTAEFFERDAARIRVGQPATITATHVPGRAYEGFVSMTGMKGRRHGQTAVVPVEVIVQNPDLRLKAGLTAEVRIQVDSRQGALAIPAAFVRHSDKGPHVLRIGPGGKAERIGVELGLTDGEYTEVRSGLGEGDRIIRE